MDQLHADQIHEGNADWLMRIAYLAGTVAADTDSDDYVSRRASSFARRVTEMVRIIDADSLTRHTAQVVRVDRERHFGFIRLGLGDYFFHHNDLIMRHEWDAIDENVLVAFLPDDQSPKGPRARMVRVLA
jgi:cold shock CspA family protein